MANPASGLATALATLDTVGDVAHDDQIQMFEADAELPIPQRASTAGKIGRPRGSRNQSTEAWRKYFLSKYRSPLIGLAEMCNRSPLDLAKDLGLRVERGIGYDKRQEWDIRSAVHLQLEAQKALLPYIHQKAPTAIELPPDTAVPLLVINLSHSADPTVGALTIPLATAPSPKAEL